MSKADARKAIRLLPTIRGIFSKDGGKSMDRARSRKEYSEQELDQQFAEATRRGEAVAANEVRAQGVRYDPDFDRIVIDLDGDRSFSFSTKLVEGLGDASPENIADVDITPDGSGLRWNSLDIDLGVSELLAGIYGTRRWMARLGQKGGSVKSVAKAAAARENGKKGGRPRANISAVTAQTIENRAVAPAIVPGFVSAEVSAAVMASLASTEWQHETQEKLMGACAAFGFVDIDTVYLPLIPCARVATHNVIGTVAGTASALPIQEAQNDDLALAA